MSKPPALVKAGGRAVASAAGPREVSTPVLLEYQSPTAELIARPVPASSHYMIWVIAVTFSALLAAMTYAQASAVAAEARETGRTIGEVVVAKGLMSRERFAELTSAEAVCAIGTPEREGST